MVAVDCNVLAYVLIDAEHTAKARALLARDPDWQSDTLVLVELSNVLATAMRVRRLPLAEAHLALVHAQDVVDAGLHEADHADVLALASQLRVSAYDARYLVVAKALGVRLVTEDAKLRRAAPALTQTIVEALAAGPA
jgi:predicted nucleic acid-binding protein